MVTHRDPVVDDFQYALKKFRQIDRVYLDVNNVAAADALHARLATNPALARSRWESGVRFTGAPKEKFIFAIWHNRLSLCLVLYRRYVARPAPASFLETAWSFVACGIEHIFTGYDHIVFLFGLLPAAPPSFYRTIRTASSG